MVAWPVSKTKCKWTSGAGGLRLELSASQVSRWAGSRFNNQQQPARKRTALRRRGGDRMSQYR
eukprot:849211-Prymnesium_polylepis.1